jgi:hypothetical protein
MDRREFLQKAALAAALVGVTVTVSSCGDDDPAAPGTGAGDVTGTATGGHTHTGVITKAQLDAGADVNITFPGIDHSHSLPLLASEVMDIAQGTRVQKNFTDLHEHTYTFN